MRHRSAGAAAAAAAAAAEVRAVLDARLRPSSQTAMQALRGLALLLLCQSAGELVARALRLPLPGPVLGMVLLLALLAWAPVREPVAAAADALLQHLSLLFVPVGVGVITHLALLAEHGLRIALVLLLSTLAGLAVTALLLRWWLSPAAATAEHG